MAILYRGHIQNIDCTARISISLLNSIKETFQALSLPIAISFTFYSYTLHFL